MLIKYKSFFNNNVILLKNKKYRDKRGFFIELYNHKSFNLLNNTDFVQDNLSFSKKINTLRGLHFQKGKYSQAKLLTVLQGKIFDVVVDINKKSKTFGQYKSFILNEKDNYTLYVGEGFAHGFCTLIKDTLVHYKVNNYYSARDEKTIIWNDKDLNIKWPKMSSDLIISNKDKKGVQFSQL